MPGVPQIRLAAVRQDIEQDFRLHEILVDLCRALAPAALAHDQLVQRVPLRRWNVHQGPAAMEDHRRNRVIDEKVEKTQRLPMRLQRRKLDRPAAVGPSVRRQNLDAIRAVIDICLVHPAVDLMRDGPEGRIRLAQDLDYRCGLLVLPDRQGNRMELREVQIAGLHRAAGELDAEQP